MSPQKVFGWSNFSLKSRTSKSRKFFSVVDVDNLIVYLRKTWLGSSSPKIWLKLSPFALSREEALWVLTKCLRSSISNLIWDTDVFNWQIPYQALIPRYFSEGSHKELEALDNIKWIIEGKDSAWNILLFRKNRHFFWFAVFHCFCNCCCSCGWC